MENVSIDAKLRPIKIAFLVDANDKKAILEAIKINSFLWGGVFNPIIPVFGKVPKLWKKSGSAFGKTAKEILNGYLNAYSPDYICQLGNCEKKKLSLKKYPSIKSSDILADIKEDGTPKYGIGLFEILSDFYKNELRFVRKKPNTFIYPSYKKSGLFFASIFGSLPDSLLSLFNENWSELLELKKEAITFENYSSFLDFEYLFFRRMTYHKLKVFSSGSCLFFMDANNSQDIVDYWNLRAIGWSIIPVAKQSVDFPDVKKMAEDFIDENSGMHRYGNFYVRATIMKSRSTDEKDVSAFIKSLSIKEDKKSDGSRVVFQHWYPRMWDEWARNKDGVVCREIEAFSKDFDFNTDGENVSLRTLDPDFAFRFGGHGTPRFANIISLRTYRNNDIYAEVIPDAGQNATRVLSGFGMLDWRFTKKESVYLAQHTKWRIHLSITKAEELFSAWLQDNGLSCTLSPAGLVAKQMIKKLGGLWGLQTIANEGIISLLREMENGKILDENDFFSKIQKIANQSWVKNNASELTKRYLDVGMFKLVARLQCPVCAHRTWYPLNSLDYKLRCVNCSDIFEVPTHSPNQIKWSYKTFGCFSLSGAGEGAYSTLLVLRLFSQILDFPTTPITSFLTKIDNSEIEVDLGILIKEHRSDREAETRVVFVEAKTFGNFEKSDIDKMNKLAKKFPGAILVFATMKEELSNKEKRLLKPLVNKGRKYWKEEQPYNPILILTKVELFAKLSIDYAWKDAGEKYKNFAEKHFYTDKLLHICDATQQLYLGMKPWHDEIREKFENRALKIKKMKEDKEY